jgi:hypothetical protein
MSSWSSAQLKILTIYMYVSCIRIVLYCIVLYFIYLYILFISTNNAQYLHFLFEQYLYYNHSYMFQYTCIILGELQRCTSLKLCSFHIITIPLKIIRLKYLCGCY